MRMNGAPKMVFVGGLTPGHRDRLRGRLECTFEAEIVLLSVTKTGTDAGLRFLRKGPLEGGQCIQFGPIVACLYPQAMGVSINGDLGLKV